VSSTASIAERRTDEAGSGLGLAIVKAIADRHRAHVLLDDADLGGLRARVEFPVAAAFKSALSHFLLSFHHAREATRFRFCHETGDHHASKPSNAVCSP
jgi:hypothetical protein